MTEPLNIDDADCPAFWRNRARIMEYHLQNLLATIHGDGGHHASEHGIEKSTAEAMRIIYKRREPLVLAEQQRDAAEAMVAHCAQGIELLEEIKRAAICIWPDVVTLSEIMDPHKQRLAEALDAYTRFLNQEKKDGG